jgi:hypothetical protein
MAVVIIALIVFGIGLTSLVLWTIRQPTILKIIVSVVSVVFVVTYGLAIIWALKEFV